MATGGKTEGILIVMAKAPMLGAVKTRLVAGLGADGALAAYRELLTDLFGNLKELDPVCLCVTPDESGPEFAPWHELHWSLWGQGEGDLGERLGRVFIRAFQEGARRVVVIGADCPYVSAEHIREAWRRLGEVDLVLGPACDGGYWLIGLSRWVPELFEGMPWSTPRLCEETLAAARRAGRAFALLETLLDVDTEEDWRGYLAERQKKIPPV